MKKAANAKWPSKKAKIWIIILGLIALALLALFFVNAILTAQDRNRFEAVSKEKSLIASKLAGYLGDNVVSTREQDECFNTEQGPWDNGYLWCQVATVINLRKNIDYTQIEQQYSVLAKDIGWTFGTNAPFQGVWIEGSEHIMCQLQYREGGQKDVGLARLIPFNDHELTTLAIACADRARGPYYTYTD